MAKTARKAAPVKGGKTKRRSQSEVETHEQVFGSADVIPMKSHRTAKSEKHGPRDAERAHKRCDLKPLNGGQADLLTSINSKTITIASGPAGTGKTYVAIVRLAQKLVDKEIQTIILTRPVVEAGEKLGFLPGDLMEKVTPYLQPYYKGLKAFFGSMSVVEALVKEGKIQVKPLAYMRGETFDNAGVILDEAQNTTPSQMKMFLTRTGKYSTVIVDGDAEQSDIRGPNGLSDLIARRDHLPNAGYVELTEIVRDDIVAEVLKAYAVKLDA